MPPSANGSDSSWSALPKAIVCTLIGTRTTVLPSSEEGSSGLPASIERSVAVCWAIR